MCMQGISAVYSDQFPLRPTPNAKPGPACECCQRTAAACCCLLGWIVHVMLCIQQRCGLTVVFTVHMLEQGLVPAAAAGRNTVTGHTASLDAMLCRGKLGVGGRLG